MNHVTQCFLTTANYTASYNLFDFFGKEVCSALREVFLLLQMRLWLTEQDSWRENINVQRTDTEKCFSEQSLCYSQPELGATPSLLSLTVSTACAESVPRASETSFAPCVPAFIKCLGM